MSSWAHRSAEPEWMDAEDLPATIFAAVLADLAWVNRLTRAHPPTLGFVRRALRALPPDRPATILDVGFGDGDMLRAIARAHPHRPLRLIGIDINPSSAPAAQARTPAHLPIEYRTGDACAIDPALRIDLVISSLVTHHMTDPDCARFLAWMDARAGQGWFVNDLHRHPLARHGFRLLAALARWHPIVRHDGAVSVARAFTRADWQRLIAQAGLDPATIRLRWHLPFRWCVSRLR